MSTVQKITIVYVESILYVENILHRRFRRRSLLDMAMSKVEKEKEETERLVMGTTKVVY